MKRDFKRQDNSVKERDLIHPFSRKVFSGYTHFECTWNTSKQSPQVPNNEKNNSFLSLMSAAPQIKQEHTLFNDLRRKLAKRTG